MSADGHTAGARRVLPGRRGSLTLEFDHQFDRSKNAFKYQATFGFHEDGSIGEVFLNTMRFSTEMDAYARDAAIALSIAVQHGASLDTLRKAMTRNADGSPSSPIGTLLDVLESV